MILASWSTWSVAGVRGAVVVSLAEIELRRWLILAFAVDIEVLVSSACSTSVSIASSSVVASSIFASNGAISSFLH